MYSTNISGYSNNSVYNPLQGTLENIVAQYATAPKSQTVYVGQPIKQYSSYSAIAEPQSVVFLSPIRPETPFIGNTFEIAEHIKQAFFATTNEQLPEDILITLASREELLKKNLAFLNNAVVGLSISTTKEIFAVSGSMDEVLLTIGHELGHIIKAPARTAQEEEAKAFAFETAWAQAIFDSDIAGLRQSINAAAFTPAKNGLHDTASNFVKNNSSDPLKLFNSISRGEITQEQIFEGSELQPTITPKGPMYSLPGKTKLYGGYLNKSRVQNLPPPHNFFWADLGRGIYGMYVPLTTVETLNSELLRKDIEQMHKTQGHEYSLHRVMGLPDGYVVEALEEAMFWTADIDDGYYPRKI